MEFKGFSFTSNKWRKMGKNRVKSGKSIPLSLGEDIVFFSPAAEVK